jgi:hypothetical protein
MKVHDAYQPVDFATGELLDPDDLNAIALYVQDALADVAGKRYARGILPLPFVEDVGTPYTNAMNTEELTYRFLCPVTCVVERGFLSANMVSSAVVNIVITDTGGNTPTGCPSPWLTTGAAVTSAATDTTDICVDKFVLTAGTEYLVKISTAGTFTIDRGDVILHTITDRWNTAGSVSVASFTPTLFDDSDAPNGTTVAGMATTLTTAVNRLASEKNAPTPYLAAVVHQFTSATDADIRTFLIPQFDSDRAQCVIRRAYLWAYMDGTGGTTVTATVSNAVPATALTLSASVAGVQQASADSGVIALDIASSATASPATTTDDWKIILAAAAGATCVKAYVLLWLGR